VFFVREGGHTCVLLELIQEVRSSGKRVNICGFIYIMNSLYLNVDSISRIEKLVR
jgi:hypothetical protein